MNFNKNNIIKKYNGDGSISFCFVNVNLVPYRPTTLEELYDLFSEDKTFLSVSDKKWIMLEAAKFMGLERALLSSINTYCYLHHHILVDNSTKTEDYMTLMNMGCGEPLWNASDYGDALFPLYKYTVWDFYNREKI